MGEWCRPVWWSERQKNNDELLIQARRTLGSAQLGCQEAGHSFSFFIRCRISGHRSSNPRSIVSETTSGGLRHPTETANSNWKGEPELWQIVPIPSRAQKEQTHWDKISFHSGQDGRWDYFSSLRSYWQNGSWLISLRNPCPYQRRKHSELFWCQTQSAQIWMEEVLEYRSNYNHQLEKSENY